MRLSLALLAALFLAAPASAQADTLVVVPGDGTLVTDWVTPGSRSYTIRLVQPMQQDIGTAVETVTVAGGEVTRVVRVSVPMQGVTQTDSLVADAATFAPRVHRSTGGAQEASLEFMDEGVVGMLTPRTGEAATVTLMTDAPVFDSAWLGEIAQSLPLAEGAVARVPVFVTQSPDEAADAVLTVTGQETMGDRTAWTVDAQMGPMTMTYVVDAETRALLATRFSPQPGVRIEIRPAD
ncbi:hypothetical protein [Rubrivirga sp.]|uniref:DUF3108 domain-containing protein n=1 Tax=Rubrivirga sp. TaxID=1885344 RepID=UPI003B51E88F